MLETLLHRTFAFLKIRLSPLEAWNTSLSACVFNKNLLIKNVNLFNEIKQCQWQTEDP
jgi:hypothetical protein